eukprot:403354599
MLKSTIAALLFSATQVLCESNHFIMSFEPSGKPIISLPQNFVLHTHLMIEKEDSSWTDTMTNVQWYIDSIGNRAKYAYVYTESGKVMKQARYDYNTQKEITQESSSKWCKEAKIEYQFNLGRFLKNTFDTQDLESSMFEYAGLVTPDFDKFEKYHAFVTKDEGSHIPIAQRATQFYFDQTGQANWIKFYMANDQSELHNIISVEENVFNNEDFGLEGCHPAVTTNAYEVYHSNDEKVKTQL